MLHIRYTSLSLLALALAGPGVSVAEVRLAAADFPPEQSASYLTPGAVDLQTDLLSQLQAMRQSAGLSDLIPHQALSDVAMAHARDMAIRGYASDVTPEGVSLIDKVRQSDRSSLYGSFGTSIAIADAGMDARRLHEALISSPANAENMLRAGFGHVGIGTHEKDGRVYVVEIFARIDGALKQRIPLRGAATPSLKAEFSAANMVPVGWAVHDAAGQPLLRGAGDRLRDGQGRVIEGYLSLDVAMGQDVYTLRGPYIRID